MEFTIAPRGPFTLASAARFIAGWEPTARAGASREDAAIGQPVEVRLAFLLDDWSGHVGLVLRQPEPDGEVLGTVTDGAAAGAGVAAVAAQAARIVSLDHDGTGWAELGAREALIGELQRASGFLRPVLFHSPYECACWGIISTRLRQPQAVKVRDELARAHGATLQAGDEQLLGFPAPEALLGVSESPGLPQPKLDRLHGVARAALDGALDREALLAMDPALAVGRLRELPGIGPFWADAILLRAVGPTDVATTGEPRMRKIVARRYDAPEAETEDRALLAIAERWRPYRTWASVLLRAAG